MQHYTIQHMTRFTYKSLVRESVMEVRMRPRDEWGQQCTQFDLSVSPHATVMNYRDWLGNHVHHFDIPRTHIQQVITAQSVIRLDAAMQVPETLSSSTWEQLESLKNDAAVWELAMPSRFTESTEMLSDFAASIGIQRLDDPLTTVRHITSVLNEQLEYKKDATQVDSTIDDALSVRAGVCQDFAHIQLALLRGLEIPCRYVSGYFYTSRDDQDDPAADATHAWVEVLLPGLGWIGFDPTHNTVCGDSHIRTAVGRDYGDVPPTRGVYRGQAESEISVSVSVERIEATPMYATAVTTPSGWVPPEPSPAIPLDDNPQPFEFYAQQMHQQQC